MQAAFPIVVFGTVGLSVVMSLVFLLSKGSMYDEIGSGGFPGEGESPGGPGGPGGGSPFGHAPDYTDYHSIARSPELQSAEREQEIRQMLQARSERAVRRGEPSGALDVDAGGGAADGRPSPRAAATTRASPKRSCSFVVARNERRERQGLGAADPRGGGGQDPRRA